jgi:hypothetical protein
MLRVWAPPDSLWSPWVKPVLFAFADAVLNLRPRRSVNFNSDWVPPPSSTALVLDLPEEEAVLWGVGLAEIGYRPVPLYNALPFAMSDKMTSPSSRPVSTVQVEPILAALVRETGCLVTVQLRSNAPPAFLLDADRRLARTDVKPGVFDNRSVCFTTDFPSAEFLLEHGIRGVMVVQETAKFVPDLLLVLLEWQKGGIRISRKLFRNSEPPQSVAVKKPSLLSWIWFRLGVALGYHRGELGAFGEIVPASSG